MIPQNLEDISTIISVLPIRLDEDKPLVPSHYSIEACKDPENDAETLMVRRGHFTVYIDENRPVLRIPEPSDVIASAICRDYKVSIAHYMPDVAEPGLFWIRGGYTKQEVLEDKGLKPELARAREKQRMWFKRLVEVADNDWATYKMRKTISDMQRVACQCLRLERDWDIDLEVAKAVRTIPCKFCRADIHPDAIICMHCRGVLNLERFRSDFVPSES